MRGCAEGHAAIESVAGHPRIYAPCTCLDVRLRYTKQGLWLLLLVTLHQI